MAEDIVASQSNSGNDSDFQRIVLNLSSDVIYDVLRELEELEVGEQTRCPALFYVAMLLVSQVDLGFDLEKWLTIWQAENIVGEDWED